MSDGLTKAAARNIFFGGSLFFFILFAALTAHSHWYIVNHSTDHAGMTDSVVAGKEVWEEHNCINCHTILGEGAYFGPEMGNVWTRFGGHRSPRVHAPPLPAGYAPSPPGPRGGGKCPTSKSTMRRWTR